MSELTVQRVVSIAAAVWLTSSAAGLAPAVAAATPVVFDARVVGDDQRVRFVADVSTTIEPTVFTLADPYRIVVDLPEVRFALPEHVGSSGRGLISAFRFGLFSPGQSRIVIDLTAPVKVDKAFVTEPGEGQPARLVVDVVPTTRTAFMSEVSAYRRDRGIAADERADRSFAATQGRSGLSVVVLDPGHGGIDSGARGNNGTLEKTVTLAFAEVLAGKLRDTGRYDVLMTRTDDSFISLGDRVAFARANDADLFMSIHANSFLGAAVRGATVYTVSDEASDKMAEEMAASENAADILAGVDIAGDDSDEVRDILLDLTRRETRNFGEAFARNLVAELGKSTRMFKIPHQRASFKVLEAPDAPSAMLELGYLSNSSDEKFLNSPEWQDGVADSVVEAIAEFFATRVAGRDGQSLLRKGH